MKQISMNGVWIVTNQTDRRKEVLVLAAETAFRLPRLDSGFWFHRDMRDNLYYAMHLYAASTDPEVEVSFSKNEGARLGEEMLLLVLGLQVNAPEHPMYGHWPLNLGNDPSGAAPHTLPVELLGSLIAWYHHRHGGRMGEKLQNAFEEAMRHAYMGNYYRKPVEYFNHHESKYVSQQVIWGELFQDKALAAEGRDNLRLLLDTIRANGMREYGAMPWFWHWVQAFSCARALVKDAETLQLLHDMLDYLWKVRSLTYLKGAWAAPHSRGLGHDIPADRNTLLDYVEYGGFPLPDSIARLEAAGILEVSPPTGEITASAADRTDAREVRRLIPIHPQQLAEGCLHSYTYMTPDFAVGGVWERATEFDNEQHRWDVTLPANRDGSVNKAYFFRPGNGFSEGDYRHEGGLCQVLLHRNAAVALFAPPEDPEAAGLVIGVLPKGDWQFGDRQITGLAGTVYLVVHLMNPYTCVENEERGCLEIRSEGGANGVAVEAFTVETASALGLGSLNGVAAAASGQGQAGLFSNEGGAIAFAGKTLADGAELRLNIAADGSAVLRTINGSPVSFEEYTVAL
ncbi:hypothetical protein DQG13_22625 [Paenibacillus sp. YN15]|nr:hypothetical protein DQG13_22625 [Paenibacillus sp. YN15]